MSLSLYLDQHYSFEISFYEDEYQPGVLCLILTPDQHYMLLQKELVSGHWRQVAGGNFHPAFQQAILESSRNLINCMLAVRPLQKAADLDPCFRI
ncbi:hypothetical protein SAMN05216464_118128 [Mucilaginibacter pineti]|uniref:Uncharacterized protein n=1 Tax=Mucilaginibacter pineti TaxID=1391627 RepID=A0A1G7LDS7_9SPHI|nr:hypothetical protein [Mucilaginibacter pineti]SDF47536.1 hypothetical protein SAMN05216464_118128 [Mucilaginibacter pineti]